MIDVDEITRRLSEIMEKLAELPDGASPGRYALLKERDKLRSQASKHASSIDDRHTNAELEAELASLRRSRQQIIRSRTGYVTSKGGNNAGPSGGAWVKLSQDSLASSGLGRINQRIAQIEGQLETRRGGRGQTSQ